jgi:predicted glycogen debranching enzyme
MIEFGREICGNLSASLEREWLITNGIGGYGSGTIGGCLTRRYQGLLISALKPPLGRVLMFTKLEETVKYLEQDFHLFANQWLDRSISPHGFHYIEKFKLDRGIPSWIFACADVRLQKQIWMEQGKNTTFVRYVYLSGKETIELEIKALVNYRDHHGDSHAKDWQMKITPFDTGVEINAFLGASSFYLQSDRGSIIPCHTWLYNFYLSQENYRGLTDREDHLHGATIRVKLEPGQDLTIIASTEKQQFINGLTAYNRKMNYINTLINPNDNEWITQLKLAADQFIVKRPTKENPNSYSVIAGYPWFGDWGRDTMISLTGLTISTKRYDIARSVLKTFAQYVDRGMLPNRFPDEGETPEYNTVDATLWFFEAIYQYFLATKDDELLKELYPLLKDIIQHHEEGTRYGIKVDPEDYLLFSGEPGVQLTWMDAKVGDWVVTPRTGKAIEINALWYNALKIMLFFADFFHYSSYEWQEKSVRVFNSFQKFWIEEEGYCYDVIDSPQGNDHSLRPNQIFAVSLSFPCLSLEQSRSVVDTCAKNLLTSFGLRSLSPKHKEYKSKYGGNVWERDGAYHQGTVWGWLLGPFVLAHYSVYQNKELALSFLQPMKHHLTIHGLGTMSEIFDGDPPHQPRGCYAQAWTVAEVLRVWQMLSE